MHDLRLVGVHDDGEHLVLTDSDGHRFRLGVDEALRAAVRRDRAHLGQIQIESTGGLRPREIQSRIRAGASAEEVSAATGWPLDKVRRYEGPVLAERAHVTDLARGVRLRRRPAEQITLGEEAGRRLAVRGVDPDSAVWDAWRTDAGPWTVSLRFEAGARAREARWHFDLTARSVTPADDEARWLSEQVPDADGPLAGARLASVPIGAVYDIDAAGGVNVEVGVELQDPTGPLELVTDRRPRRTDRAAGSGRRRPAAADLDPRRLAEPPAAHPPAQPPRPSPQTPAPQIQPQAPAPPRPQTPAPAARAAPAPARTAPAQPDPVPAPSARVSPGGGEQDAEPAVQVEATEEGQTTPRPARGRNRRASVPSWDDIMFGAKRD